MPSSSDLPPMQGDPQSQRIEAELISIRPNGFEPTQIRRPKGPFFWRLRIAADSNKSNSNSAPRSGRAYFK
jgi:hypothetical protein